MNQLIKTHIENKSIEWQNISRGIRRKVLGYDSGLMMVLVEFEKAAVGAPHKHPQRQVTYIVSGSFDVQVGEVKQELRHGDCFFVPPNIVHSVIALEESTLVDVFAPFREDFLK